MSEDLCRLVEDVESGRVFTVEAGGIWFSGMNSGLQGLIQRVGDRLEAEGYTVGSPRFDDADMFGGMFLPVAEAEPVEHDTHNRIVSPPGGDPDPDGESSTGVCEGVVQ